MHTFPPAKQKQKTTDIDDTSADENDERCEHFFSYAKPSKAKNCQKPKKTQKSFIKWN